MGVNFQEKKQVPSDNKNTIYMTQNNNGFPPNFPIPAVIISTLFFGIEEIF